MLSGLVLLCHPWIPLTLSCSDKSTGMRGDSSVGCTSSRPFVPWNPEDFVFCRLQRDPAGTNERKEVPDGV